MTETITLAHRVKVYPRCRKCGSLQLRRESSQDETSLWTFTHRCTMCSWTVAVPNVKLGV